jgi:hypothetical protein
MKTKNKHGPCHPQLDAILDDYFCPEGASIKSISAITARGTTSPLALTRAEVQSEVGKLTRGLTGEELSEVALYYEWRAAATLATHKAAEARREARGRAKRVKFRTGIGEIERKWIETKKSPR